MLLPIAVMYDAYGEISSIRFFQFNMVDCSNKEWLYYNSLVSTHFKRLQLKDYRVFDVEISKLWSNAVQYFLNVDYHVDNSLDMLDTSTMFFDNVDSITKVTADGRVLQDSLQVIAVRKNFDNKRGQICTEEGAEKQSSIRCYVVDWKGHIKLVEYATLCTMIKGKGIVLGNMFGESMLTSVGKVTLQGGIEFASLSVQEQRKASIAAANLFNLHGDSVSMFCTIPNEKSVVIPEGWKAVESDKFVPEVQSLSVPSRCILSTKGCLPNLKQLKLPELTSSILVDESKAELSALKMPEKVFHMSGESNFLLYVKSLPESLTSIDESGWSDLQWNKIYAETGNLRHVKLATCHREGNWSNDFLLSVSAERWWNSSTTELTLRDAGALEDVVFLNPVYEKARRPSDDSVDCVLILGDAVSLQTVHVKPKVRILQIELDGILPKQLNIKCDKGVSKLRLRIDPKIDAPEVFQLVITSPFIKSLYVWQSKGGAGGRLNTTLTDDDGIKYLHTTSTLKRMVNIRVNGCKRGLGECDCGYLQC